MITIRLDLTLNLAEFRARAATERPKADSFITGLRHLASAMKDTDADVAIRKKGCTDSYDLASTAKILEDLLPTKPREHL